jgi:PadR family transcriptional regulator PadR
MGFPRHSTAGPQTKPFKDFTNKGNGAFVSLLTDSHWRDILGRDMLSIDHARKNGSAELLILAQIETAPRHGYEIACEIERRSSGTVSFKAASLYPVLYRLERKGWIAGRWVERAGQRRRRYYRLTVSGRKQLAVERSSWSAFLAGLRQTAGLQDA